MPVIQKKNMTRNYTRCRKLRSRGICMTLLLLPRQNHLNSILGRIHIKVHPLLIKFYAFINLISKEFPSSVFKNAQRPTQSLLLAFTQQNAIYSTDHFQGQNKILSIITIKYTSHTKQLKNRIPKSQDAQVCKYSAALNFELKDRIWKTFQYDNYKNTCHCQPINIK